MTVRCRTRLQTHKRYALCSLFIVHCSLFVVHCSLFPVHSPGGASLARGYPRCTPSGCCSPFIPRVAVAPRPCPGLSTLHPFGVLFIVHCSLFIVLHVHRLPFIRNRHAGQIGTCGTCRNCREGLQYPCNMCCNRRRGLGHTCNTSCNLRRGLGHTCNMSCNLRRGLGHTCNTSCNLRRGLGHTCNMSCNRREGRARDKAKEDKRATNPYIP
jgi:hypothetical protein